MNFDELCAFFTQRQIEFDVKTIQYGRQVRAKTGEIISVYDSGKVVVGGKNSPIRAELDAWNKSGFLPAMESASPATDAAAIPQPGYNRRVFIVYGHDLGARDGLELLLRRMDLEPVVLANLPAAGDTVIEKLERYLRDTGNVGFACVLLTPDDEGHRVGATEEKRYRARQNVILELGMVLSRLSRQRVAILYKESVERPSDIDGLLYLPFKEKIDEVKAALFKELQNAGYTPNPAAL